MKPTHILRSFLLTAGSSLLAISSASAADGTYNSQTGAWNVAGSWTSGIADGADSTAFFTNDVTTSDRSTSLGANRIIGNIVFTDADNTTGNGFNRTLTGNTLTLDVSSGAPSIDVTQSNRTLRIDSIIAGNDGLTKTGLGTLAIAGSNTYTGATTVSQGTLNVLDNTNGLKNSTSLSIAAGATVNATQINSLMPGAWTIAGTLNKTDNTGQDFYNGVTLNNGTISGSADKTDFGTYFWAGGSITANGSSNTINAARLGFGGGTANTPLATDALSISSILGASSAANGTLTKNGLGTLTLSGNNIYTGATTINAGTLNANHATNSLGSGALNVNGGTLALGANSDTVGAVTIAGGSITSSTGVLTGTSYAAQSGSVSARLGGTGVALTKTTAGTVTLSGVNSYTGATNVNAGTLQVSGSGSINTTSAINVAAGATFSYNSSVALTVAPTLNSTVGNKATFSGSGNLGTLAFTYNSLDDVISPGNSPGIQAYGASQTWSALTYAWELNDWADDVGGTDFDLITVAGSLNLSGASYALDVLSLNAANATGLVGAGGGNTFTETNNSWTILTTTGGITNFDALEWSINTAGFLNTDTGTWSLSLVNAGNDLLLSYTAIPEPGAALLGSLGLLALLRRRR